MSGANPHPPQPAALGAALARPRLSRLRSSLVCRFDGLRFWVGSLALLALVATAYIPALNGGFVWDDDDHVINMEPLRSLHGLGQIWLEPRATGQYYPLTFTGFWAQYQLWELNPLGFHLTNVVLHAVNAVLLWLILIRLSVRGAWVAAAIFALHPVHVMSVAWITELKNVLSFFFVAAALLAYLRFSGLPKWQPQWRYYALTVVLFMMALLSKTATASLPFALLMISWWKRDRLGWAQVLPLAPILALGLAMGSLTLFIERQMVGAVGGDFATGLAERVLVVGKAFWFYVGKLLWPNPLIFFYPRWQLDPFPWHELLYPLCFVLLVFGLWRYRGDIGKAPLAAVGYFAVASPLLVLVQVLYMMQYSFVSDHWIYFASPALIALAVAGMSIWLKQWPERGRPVGVAASVGVLVTLWTLTWSQCHAYRDEITLYRDTIRKNPGSWVAHNNLGNRFLALGRLESAEQHLRKALAANPRFARAHNNLGVVLLQKGALREATEHLEEAIRLDPDLSGAYGNLGVIRMAGGQNEEALSYFLGAIELKPDDAQAHYYAGLSLLALADPDQALSHLRIAIHVDPTHARAHFEIGRVLLDQGRVREAVSAFRKALQLKPDWPLLLNNLAWVLASRDDPAISDPELAVALAQRACDLTSHAQPVVLDTLAAAHAALGRFDQAVPIARRALELSEARGQIDASARIRARLALYEEGQPYREK